ncbi:MAG: molybdopterin-dependent oxidoreductase [Deltaproteobacteria bacterium]|nr:molybdopterin-dependent oxidoreductase [Deltaproteobacteria bacterium]
MFSWIGWCLVISFVAALAVSSTSSLAQQSTKNPSDVILRITGKIDHPLVVRLADLQALARKRVAVTDDRGAHVSYEGVPVVELLQRAGVPLGKRLRGAQMKFYVVVSASDGYQVVFALPEFDPGFTDRVILLADRRDGHPLSPSEGPFRIVVPGEKRHARWVREVTNLDIEQAQ